MTCEVIIMNKSALVLAADSAVTLTKRNEDDHEDKRYFKSVNKVFQLSEREPVGIMIYGAGSLHQAPWEVIIKEYRRALGKKSFATVPEYADHFFQFLETATGFFPREFREHIFLTSCYNSVYKLIKLRVEPSEAYKTAKTQEDKLRVSEIILDALIKDIDNKPYFANFTADDEKDALSNYLKTIEVEISPHISTLGINTEKAASAAIKAIFKFGPIDVPNSGVVFAGYGREDFFPSFHEYNCRGLTFNKFVRMAQKSVKINHVQSSSIETFAMSEMVNTFLVGLSDTLFQVTDALCRNTIDRVMGHLPSAPPENIHALIDQELSTFRNKLLEEAFKRNYTPISEIVASFPIEDMADLAETLVRLESVKEKVTQPTESVGGPVDVAVITKAQGLIWIKRKHYFDPRLNARYFDRLKLDLNDEAA